MTFNEQQLWILVPCVLGAIGMWFTPSPGVLLRKLASATTKSEAVAIDPHVTALKGLDLAIRQLRAIGAIDERTASNMTLFDAHERLRASYLPFVGELSNLPPGVSNVGPSNQHKPA